MEHSSEKSMFRSPDSVSVVGPGRKNARGARPLNDRRGRLLGAASFGTGAFSTRPILAGDLSSFDCRWKYGQYQVLWRVRNKK
jgi:hypothetical protein